MLSIGRLGPDGGRYYLSQVATGREDYYMGAGEAPGHWMGSGLSPLGLSGQVDPETFTRILAGLHPATGEPLVAAADGRVQGLDLTFSAPKSVSLLWALHPDPAIRRVVADAHDRAVADALGFLETDALRARRGRNGLQRVPVEGMIAAGFGHRASRAGDPQLHTHVVAANLARDQTGRWSAIDTRAVYRHARTAGYLYQARLRHELTRVLGVEWGPVHSGQADLAHIDRAWLQAFSTRRADIIETLAERGLSSAAAARVATLDTRPTKTAATAVTPVGLFERWRRQAADIGVSVEGLVGPGRETRPPGDLLRRLASAGGLTARAASFDRRDLMREAAAGHPEGATLDQLETLAARLISETGVVELSGEGTDAAARRWTTVDLLGVEADLLAIAQRGARVGIGRLDLRGVREALTARPQLSAEQAELVRGLAETASSVACVVGKAGAGKTFALDALRAACDSDGVTVVGSALSARAAAELQAGSGIASTTLARLLADIRQPRLRPPAGSLIVVDEAGMVGTRQLHELISRAERHRWRVVLVGDPHQLPEIQAGGGFEALCRHVPTWTLSANLRQTDPWERAALDRLRHRQPSPAVAAYQRHGRVIVAASAPALQEVMVADWHRARRDGSSTVMLAVRRTQVEQLNQAAQAVRVAAGEIDPASGVEVAGRRLLVGDEVICTRNDRRAGLLNGSRLTITALSPGEALTGTGPDGGRVTVPWDYAASGQLQLGYAVTVHKAQGATVDQAFLLGDDRLFAEAGYVGLSRGRQANRLYIVTQPPPERRLERTAEGIGHVITALGISRAQTLSTSGTFHDHPGGRPLRDLMAEQERLLEAITADMPADPAGRMAQLEQTRRDIETAPAGAGWAIRARQELAQQTADVQSQLDARHRWATAHRSDGQALAQLTVTIDQRLRGLVQAAVVDPSETVTTVIGPRPESPAARPEWERAAAALAIWQELGGTGRLDPRRAGPPERRAEVAWWAQARHYVEKYTHLHLEHEIDKSKGLEL